MLIRFVTISAKYFWHETCVFSPSRTEPMIQKVYVAQGVGETPSRKHLAGPQRSNAGPNDFDREAQKRVGKRFERIQLAGPQYLHRRRSLMLWTITFLLIVLWLLGMISNYTMGGFIHVLLVIAIAAVLIRLIQGRRPV